MESVAVRIRAQEDPKLQANPNVSYMYICIYTYICLNKDEECIPIRYSSYTLLIYKGYIEKSWMPRTPKTTHSQSPHAGGDASPTSDMDMSPTSDMGDEAGSFCRGSLSLSLSLSLYTYIYMYIHIYTDPKHVLVPVAVVSDTSSIPQNYLDLHVGYQIIFKQCSSRLSPASSLR